MLTEFTQEMCSVLPVRTVSVTALAPQGDDVYEM